MHDELKAAYRATNYWVDDAPNSPFAIRIDEPCLDLAVLLLETGAVEWAYVTACNPRSQRLDDAENAARLAQLEVEVQRAGWPFYRGRGEGPDGAWPPEPSLLILGISVRDAKALGRRYEQNAIVAGGADGVGRLAWLV